MLLTVPWFGKRITNECFAGDVGPGEALIVDLKGKIHSRICTEDAHLYPCIFEHVYFARPDSVMDGVSVYQSRLNMGEHLAHKVNWV
jgi:amidophosphoribosyltransferase